MTTLASAKTNETYVGTAIERTANARARAKALDGALDGDWDASTRPKLLRAAGLREINDVAPGKGNTSHCFNDFNHVDATCMVMESSDNTNDGRVRGIARGNALGEGIRVARDASMGDGGSWCTCILGANEEPPRDVAHVQFQSKIAWKLVWVPGERSEFRTFVLVDDAGEFLAKGTPTGNIPRLSERERNYEVVRGGRYARVADELSRRGGEL